MSQCLQHLKIPVTIFTCWPDDCLSYAKNLIDLFEKERNKPLSRFNTKCSQNQCKSIFKGEPRKNIYNKQFYMIKSVIFLSQLLCTKILNHFLKVTR